jgi:HK97 family phage major capsid protein
MPTVVEEARGRVEQKSKELDELFKTKPNLDFTEDEVKDIQAKNKELDELSKDWEAKRAVELVAETNRKRMEEFRQPAQQMQHPGGMQEQKSPIYIPGDTRDGGRIVQVKRLSEYITEAEGYKREIGLTKKSWVVEAPEVNLFDYKTLMTTAAGFAPATTRGNILILSSQRRPMIADLIPQDGTDQVAIRYMEETLFTNNAASTAEGATKPESALQYTERTVPVEVISTWLPVTNQQLDDVPQLRNLVDNRLTLMLQLSEETQLMNGTGVSPQLTGFMVKSGVQVQARGTDPAPDAIYKAFTLVRFTGFADPTGVIMHPTDWQNIRLLRTPDGVYIWGSPADPGVERLWGVPVIPTPAATFGTALTGDFQLYSHISRKQGIRIDISDSHGTYFVENKQAIRIEERLSLEIYKPDAFAKVTGL